MHFFPEKNRGPFLVVASKTQAANAADCFTVEVKQIKWSDMVTFLYSVTQAQHLGRAEPGRWIFQPGHLTWRALV